jgi:hypothetical protein
MLPSTIGDIFGFLAVIFTGLSAFLMVARSKILKITRNLQGIRLFHIAISFLAGLFMLLHISFYLNYPMNTGIILGYATVGTAIIVWLTGSAFLEKVKDSLLFHGSLSIVLISLALIHAASSAANFPDFFSEAMVLAAVGVLIANIAYHVSKI